ncbi:hypothetical protein [Oceanobacillus damuensis]|uniref:hypothetical protein n=1 Tax=Oceanobacillus damuensis TaxID=937928 RepID=UPI0012EE6EE5|nr:hypothetical protein [Oceanobacillus damuensis]
MPLKEDKPKKEYFNLPKNDKLDFDLEEEEKAEKDQVAEKVFEKLNEKYGK